MKSIIILMLVGCLAAFCSSRVTHPEGHELLILATVACIAGAVVRSFIYITKPRDRK